MLYYLENHQRLYYNFLCFRETILVVTRSKIGDDKASEDVGQ
jgi:hypothetical protein